MAATRKEAKVDFANQKEDLFAKAKEAKVDIAHTPGQKRRVRG